MIPMTCPSCGRRGNVPPDRLNTRMHCKKCDAVFFMDKTGKIVLGDPEIVLKKAKKDQAAKANAKTKAKKKKRNEPETTFADLLLKLPTPVKGLLVGLVFLSLLFLMGFRLPRLFKSVPQDVDSLTAYLVNAWVDEKVDDIKKISSDGGGDAVKKWYDELRPKFEFKGPQDEKTGHTVQIVNNGVTDREGRKEVLINVINPTTETPADVKAQKDLWKAGKASELRGDVEAGYKWNGTFTLPLVFSSPDGQKWQFDAERSLTLGQPKPKEAPKKKR